MCDVVGPRVTFLTFSKNNRELIKPNLASLFHDRKNLTRSYRVPHLLYNLMLISYWRFGPPRKNIAIMFSQVSKCSN